MLTSNFTELVVLEIENLHLIHCGVNITRDILDDVMTEVQGDQLHLGLKGVFADDVAREMVERNVKEKQVAEI